MKKAELGVIVTLLGVFLFFVNVCGFCKTFPLAGFITMSIGGPLMKEG
jgi:multisubunit Na+/H+ antiporter MnhG subunit